MSNAIMLSVQPQWCDLIASGKKTIEIRKNSPKLPLPFKCYIYETRTPLRWNSAHDAVVGGRGGMVIGEFICDEIVPINVDAGKVQNYTSYNLARSCVPHDDIVEYLGAKGKGFGWLISDLVIYEEAQYLSEFNVERSNQIWTFTKKLERAPQSWCYVLEKQ